MCLAGVPLVNARSFVAIALPLIASIYLGGCSRDKDETFNEVEKSVASWSATLRLSAEQWSAEQVPAVYIGQIAEAADTALVKEASTLRKVPASEPGWRELNSRLARLRDL